MVSTQILQANTPAIAPVVLLLSKTRCTQPAPGKGLSISFPAKKTPPLNASHRCQMQLEMCRSHTAACTAAWPGKGQDEDPTQAAGTHSPDSPRAEGDRTPLLPTLPVTVSYSPREQHRAGSARRWHPRCCARPAWTKPQLQEFPRKAKPSPERRGGGSCRDKSQSLTVGFKHYVINKERQLDNPRLSPSPGCQSPAAPWPPASCHPLPLCFLPGGLENKSRAETALRH